MYSITVRDDIVELRARAPSMQEAASIEGVPEEEREVVVILKVESDGELTPKDAYVEGPAGRTPIPLDEIKWWLDVLESTQSSGQA